MAADLALRTDAEMRTFLRRHRGRSFVNVHGEGGEHLIVNVWRPLREVEQWGLAVMDGSTLAQGDVHPTTMNLFDNNPGGPVRAAGSG